MQNEEEMNGRKKKKMKTLENNAIGMYAMEACMCTRVMA